MSALPTVAATHRNLEAGVERGTFREDIYYRLWWAVLEVPPLRARCADIALLVEHFRREVGARRDLGLDITGVTRAAMAILERNDWPGNVRELEAVVTRAMVRRRRGWVTPEDIVLPRLRRDRLPEALRTLPRRPSAAQEGRRMTERAAHLVDAVLPWVPVRQWVLESSAQGQKECRWIDARERLMRREGRRARPHYRESACGASPATGVASAARSLVES